MIRKAIIVVLALAALLTACLTVTSYAGPVTLAYYASDPPILWRLSASGGKLRVTREDDAIFPYWEEGPGVYSCKLRRASFLLKLPLGHGAYAVSPSPFKRPSVYTLPGWGSGVVTLMFAAYPTIAFIRGPLRRWRRSRGGLCLKCGYDLTGNVSGVCPECGTKIEQPPDSSEPKPDERRTGP
jgi:hypothetical protein